MLLNLCDTSQVVIFFVCARINYEMSCKFLKILTLMCLDSVLREIRTIKACVLYIRIIFNF